MKILVNSDSSIAMNARLAKYIAGEASELLDAFQTGSPVVFLQTKNKGSAEIFYQPNDGEFELFAKLILRGLAEAGWEAKAAYPIESKRPHLSPTLAIGAQATGITCSAPPDR
jgi:hypothetical protein